MICADTAGSSRSWRVSDYSLESLGLEAHLVNSSFGLRRAGTDWAIWVCHRLRENISEATCSHVLRDLILNNK